MEKMKKTLIFLSLLAMAMGFVACSNNDDFTEQTEVPQNTKMTIVASLDATTRTSLGSDGLVKWSEGDKIVLTQSGVVGGKGKEFTLVSGAGTTQATFEGDVLANGNYKAYYGIGTDLILSGAQTYVADNVKDAPMYATVSVTDGKTAPVQFKNLCGILELTLKKSVFEKVRSIIIASSQSLSGTLSVSGSGDAISSTLGTGATNTIVLDCGENGVALTESGVKFNIIMPQNDYTGVGIQIFATDGSVCTKKLKSTSVLPITRSEITPTSFTATTDEQESHEYIGLGLPSGKKWALLNIGAQKEASESGNYYAWGEIAPKSNYTKDTYKWGSNANAPTKYNSTDGKTRLDLTDDVAVMNWGGKWHIPTIDDWNELKNNCHIEYVGNYNNSGKRGYIVYLAKYNDKGTYSNTTSGSKYSSTETVERSGGFFGIGGTTKTTQADAHIFLPIVSYYEGYSLVNAGGSNQYAYYWSADRYTSVSNARLFRGDGASKNAIVTTSSLGRYYGMPIRAVRDADPAPSN